MSNIVVEGKTLKDEDKVLNFENKIREVVKIGNTYIVRFAYDKIRFNVYAYDMNGKELWNINDILKLEYEDVYVALRKSEEHENCIFINSYDGIRYCIDVKKKEVIEKIITK